MAFIFSLGSEAGTVRLAACISCRQSKSEAAARSQ